MCTGIETALIIGAIAGGVGTGYSIYSAEEAKGEAKEARAQEQESQRRLQSEIESRRTTEESEETARRTQEEARRRQRALATGGRGRRDTLLTGPLGAVGEAQTARKTLLGA